MREKNTNTLEMNLVLRDKDWTTFQKKNVQK